MRYPKVCSEPGMSRALFLYFGRSLSSICSSVSDFPKSFPRFAWPDTFTEHGVVVNLYRQTLVIDRPSGRSGKREHRCESGTAPPL